MLNGLRQFRLFSSFQTVLKSEMPYYAVRTGRNQGVYNTWDDCKREVDHFPKARFKKFGTEQEAAAFVRGSDSYDYQGGSSYNDSYQPSSSYGQQSYGSSYSDSTSYQPSSSYGQQTYKQTSKKSSSYGYTPYSRGKAASSATWKQNRSTQLIDSVPAQRFHTSSYDDEESGSSGSRSAVVYTDGACSNNGQGKANAGIGVYWGPDHPLNTSERLSGRQTNNRAEIHAVAKAARQAKSQGLQELTVKTDSQFLINSMTKWLPGWKRNGWQIKDGSEVKNKEDFQELERAASGMKIKYVHVRGHQGNQGNECADRLAVAGASKPYYKKK